MVIQIQETRNGNSATFEDDPIAMLLACHGKVKRFCADLEKLPGYVQEAGWDSIAHHTVAAIIRYFEVAAPLHHCDEEEDFFPLLEKVCPFTRLEIAELQDEHHQLHVLWQALLQELTGHPECLDSVLVQRFTATYAAHMLREEQLFALGQEHMAQSELVQMGKRMAARRQIAS